MKVIANFFSRFMAIIVLVVAALALFVPATGMWIQLKAVNYLLMVVMFGMGLTLNISDFKVVFTQPKNVLIGCVAQFTIMPALAYVLGKAFGLEAGIFAGVVLVGCCPGGTASNVMTYLAKGDVALSVGMTSINTLLAPVLTPFLVYLLLGASIEVDTWGMFLSILEIVVIPLAIGFAVTSFFPVIAEKAKNIVPTISVIAIGLIIASVVSNNSVRIMNTALVVFTVVILHNLLGYLFGYLVGRAFLDTEARRRALAIEVGMQNSGLATSLSSAFGPAIGGPAAIPGAIFSVWHNISGSLLASYFARKSRLEEQKASDTSKTESSE